MAIILLNRQEAAAETGVTWPQSTENTDPPEIRRGHEEVFL